MECDVAVEPRRGLCMPIPPCDADYHFDKVTRKCEYVGQCDENIVQMKHRSTRSG